MRITEKDASRLVRVVRQAKIPQRSEGISIVATDARELIQIGLLLEFARTRAWMAASGIIDAFSNRPFNVIVVNLPSVSDPLAIHQQISASFSPTAAVTPNKCDALSPFILNPALCKSINLVPHQHRTYRFRQIENPT